MAKFDAQSAHMELANEPFAVTVSECCRLTSLGRTTIYALIRDKVLEAKHVRGRTLILMRSIRALLGLDERADANA